MNLLTIARQYGAGGRELGRLLAERLGWELLDRELLHQAAEVEHVPDADLERLDEKAVQMIDRLRLNPPHRKYLRGLAEAVRRAASRGHVILVGRGARYLLGDWPGALHVRLVAPEAWRARRMAALEGWSESEALARCQAVDQTRERFLRYFFAAPADQPSQYDVTVHSAWLPPDATADVLATVLQGESPVNPEKPAGTDRVMTLSRELGAGEHGFAPTLAERLGLTVFDRELLEQEAARLGVPEADLEKIDEQPAGLFGRLRSGSLQHRYFEAMGQLIRELAERGNVLLVGRGASRFLHDRPGCLHVHLVAAMAERVRRLMEHRWLCEDPARKLIAQSDARRRRFFETYFGADWASPLEYHLTVNSGRLGPVAVELIARAAEHVWKVHSGPS